MNKYQEDLGRIARLKLENGKVAEDFLPKTFKELQELVEKEIPMLIIDKELIVKSELTGISRYDWSCPKCNCEHFTSTVINYCPNCGQRINFFGGKDDE